MTDVEEMAAKSLCLSWSWFVLFSAGFAGNAVDEVGTLATDVVFSAGGGANEFAFPLYEWAKLTFGVGQILFCLFFLPRSVSEVEAIGGFCLLLVKLVNDEL